MMLAMPCQLWVRVPPAAAEFRLDIISKYYYATLVSRNEQIMSSSPPTSARDQLINAAREAMKNAYAPYSHFKVGAALLTSTGEIVTGCNVENASYGVTNCAERTAIFSAVARIGPTIEISAIAIVNDHEAPCAPCGACRQVIYEFGPKATVYFLSAKGWTELPITALLPEGFRLQ